MDFYAANFSANNAQKLKIKDFQLPYKSNSVLKIEDMNVTKSYLKDLTYKINGACIEVHKIMGPGLLERVYHKCLEQEFKLQGINFRSQFHIPVIYKGITVDNDYRCDFLIEDLIVLEIKSVSEFNPIHRAKVIHYINLLQKPKGILVNFNVEKIYPDGQETFVNKYFEHLPH